MGKEKRQIRQWQYGGAAGRFALNHIIFASGWKIVKAAFLKLMGVINRAVMVFLVFLLALAFVMLFAQIVSRYVLKIPFLMGDEISRYATVWIVFLGTALAARGNEMIKMEVIYSIFPFADNNRVLFEWFCHIITIIFFFFVFTYGLSMMKINSTQVTPILGIKMAIPYAALPAGSLLIIANTIASLCTLGTEKSLDPLEKIERESSC